MYIYQHYNGNVFTLVYFYLTSLIAMYISTGCHSSCSEGLKRCSGLRGDECCNYYNNSMCVDKCPSPFQPNTANECVCPVGTTGHNCAESESIQYEHYNLTLGMCMCSKGACVCDGLFSNVVRRNKVIYQQFRCNIAYIDFCQVHSMQRKKSHFRNVCILHMYDLIARQFLGGEMFLMRLHFVGWSGDETMLWTYCDMLPR